MLCVQGFACMYVCLCTTHVQSLWKSEEYNGYTELELHMAVSYCVEAGIEIRFSQKRVSVVN